jgi:hypothetical protein
MPATEMNDDLGVGTDGEDEADVTPEGNSADDILASLMGETPAADPALPAEKAKKEPKPKAVKGPKPKHEAKPEFANSADDGSEWFMGYHFPLGLPESTRQEMMAGASMIEQNKLRDEHRARVLAKEEADKKAAEQD